MRTLNILAFAGAATLSAVALAQTTPTPSVAPPPPTSGARDPISLPGDNLPPPLAAVVAMPAPAGAPANPNAPRPAEPPLPASPPLDIALAATQAALAKCHASGYEVGAAVANSIGVIVVGIQADKAHPGRVYNAMRKNLVAVEFGTPSSVVRDKLRANDYATLARVKPNMTLFPGAIPLFSHGKLVGAVAVSGGPGGEADEVCAAAGAAAVKDKLG